MEGVVHEGWLVKSPPEKRILKAKWRQRWFVLRHSGLLPGQFVLEYFTDESCRKLKGKIDLDQCEQVDAGLTFEGKKTNYQYMFDIRTPKRIYYLVAETEVDMNKWIDCICSVCGLKIHIEEDYLTQESTGNVAVSSASASSNLTETKSSSNPYIPISECHTGKPVLNGDVPKVTKFSDLPKDAPPPPPVAQSEQSLLREFYDFPRTVQPVSSAEAITDLSYKAPSSLKLAPSDVGAFNDGSKTLPPRVNWNTHPHDTVTRSHTTIVRRNSSDRADSALAAYDVVPPLHSVKVNKKLETVRREVQELANEFDQAGIGKSTQETSNGISQQTNDLFRAPPRPPKPSKLRDHRHEYENFEPLQLAAKVDTSAYDIPQPPKEVPLDALQSLPLDSKLNKETAKDIPLTTKVPLSSLGESSKLVDDTYDFPKFRGVDNINAPIPLLHGSGSMQKQRRHAYSNAPPGLFNSKELIFNYEYRPSLLNDYVNMDAGKQELCESSATGPYANLPASPSFAQGLQNDGPPVVDRGLKPRKSSEKGMLNFLTLQPPPLYKTRANKCSFRRPGERYMVAPGTSSALVSGLNGTPPVPNRFRHHLDASGMAEDDHTSHGGSRHNSSNDDLPRHYFVGGCSKKDEIQYLDLDLDSEPSPSPKSPERVSATVYKKVDFVKTKAFNEMRQNVEETYRKSQ